MQRVRASEHAARVREQRRGAVRDDGVGRGHGERARRLGERWDPLEGVRLWREEGGRGRGRKVGTRKRAVLRAPPGVLQAPGGEQQAVGGAHRAGVRG